MWIKQRINFDITSCNWALTNRMTSFSNSFSRILVQYIPAIITKLSRRMPTLWWSNFCERAYMDVQLGEKSSKRLAQKAYIKSVPDYWQTLTTNMENISNRGDSLHKEIPMHRCKIPKSWGCVIERKNDPGCPGWMKDLRGNIPFTITIPQVTEATRFSPMSTLSLSTISSGKTRVTNCASGTTFAVLPLPAGYSIYPITTQISRTSYPSARTTCTWLPREAFDTRVPIETSPSRRSLWSPGTWIPGDSYKEKKRLKMTDNPFPRDLILKIIINLSWTMNSLGILDVQLLL